MNWIDLLRQYICQIYEEWGGNCADLGLVPVAWIDALAGEYKENGAPKFPSQDDLDRFLGELTQLETHLDLDDNSLEAAENASLRTLIASLRSDLGVTA